MAKRKNNTLSNLKGSKVSIKNNEVEQAQPESSTFSTAKPRVTRAKSKPTEKITIIETNEENLATTSNVEEAIIEENTSANVVIEDMIKLSESSTHGEKDKNKKSQYQHPLLQDKKTESSNPYENLVHLYATLMQDMAKFQQEYMAVTWKLFIEQSNQVLEQYYNMFKLVAKKQNS
ncbi:MAG: hypothetical protein NZ455_10665 [Bacteroidia bacterium]|nr:hypothetical protein [Bacteroidia bacterium]MDW8301858.1 hypothetical protein [Bacteroidia bacterium]